MCASLSLASGCKKSDCDLTEEHVHLYTKDGYIKYMQNENLYSWDYKWNEEFYYPNRKDIELQKFLDKKYLLSIDLNLEKIKEVQSLRVDYIEYQYEYTTKETKTTYDPKTEKYIIEEVEDTKTAWTTNEHHRDLTGERRLCHPMYQAYKVELNEKGKYVLKKSDYVDDVLAIKDEYPYIKDDYCKIVYKNLPKEYRLWR